MTITVKEKIYNKLCELMPGGEADACYIGKGYHYDGSIESNGWYYIPFGATAIHLGENWQEAQEVLDQIIEYRTAVH